MILDGVCPDFDATRVEHRIVDGSPDQLYEVVLAADFIDAWRGNRAVRALFAVRSLAERVAAAVRGRALPEEPEVASLRLGDMGTTGDWVRLGEDPPREVAFGVIGRFWAGETVWEEIDAGDFASFDRPGFAKIACNISLRPYGEERTLVSYEARIKATDPDSRRAFLRYWRPLSPFIGVVMRSLLSVVARNVHRG